MTTPRRHATREATIDDDLLRERICLYVKVLFLIHLGFWVLSTMALALGLQMPGATAPTQSVKCWCVALR